jgi:ATP-dependent 26S proteasome regulatory subunit
MSAHLPLDAQANIENTVAILLDSEKPSNVRAKILMDVVYGHGGNPVELIQLFAKLLEQIGKQGTAAEVAKLKAKIKQLHDELESGPQRSATVVGPADQSLPGPKRRILVVTRDGAEAYPLVPEEISIDSLKPGMTAFLDPKGAIVLGFSTTLPVTGQEGRFLRRLPGTSAVQVEFRDERHTVYASQEILDAEAAGELRRGSPVLFCPMRRFAYRVLPAETDRRHRFVDRQKVPDVVPTRDIGKPHWVLGWLLRRLRILLRRPDLCSLYGLRPRVSVALTGPSGTGKTHTIKGFLHEFNKMLVEFTGRDDIGTRALRAKTSDLLSQWFGQTDHNIDEFFNDLQWLASQEYETADGRMVRLPVVVILEEFEGIAKRRGADEGGVYDRIIGMLLQRLDDTTDDLAGLPIFFLATTNRPEMVDSAMWARLASVAARFERLDREATAAILSKKLKPTFPYASDNGAPPEQLRQSVIDRTVAWMFSPNGEDAGQVELTFRDGAKLMKHRRDFLTGRLIEQALATAIDRAVFAAEEPGQSDLGLSAPVLIDALRETIDGLADNVTPHNAADYLDLPEQALVASVRRIRSHNGRLAHLVV